MEGSKYRGEIQSTAGECKGRVTLIRVRVRLMEKGVAETDFKEVTVMQLSCGGVGGGKGEIRKRPRGENVQAHNQKEGIFLVQGS